MAIVGARASTDYGDHVSGSLAAGCVARGWSIVSGGAYGIDAAAHRGALAGGGTTVAVLASGIDRLYPAGHGGLLDEVAATGLLVSEAAPGCPPSRSRFLVRNRLIAALSQGTVVVEAALRSGSLNTARWARDLSRPLMGVPGPVTSMMSAGVHELLRQPETVLVTDADEVLELVSPIGTTPAPVKQGPVGDRDALGRGVPPAPRGGAEGRPGPGGLDRDARRGGSRRGAGAVGRAGRARVGDQGRRRMAATAELARRALIELSVRLSVRPVRSRLPSSTPAACTSAR